MGGYPLKRWNIKCFDNNDTCKLQNFMKSKEHIVQQAIQDQQTYLL